jgi:hypothetical protein
MKLSLVFVNFNCTGPLTEALESVRRNPPDVPYETIVVDNASREDPSEMLHERFPGLRVIRSPINLGYGPAANLGFDVSSGEYVAAVNPDILVLPGSLDALIAFMDERPDAGAVVPQTFYPDMTPQSNVRSFHRPRYLLFGRKSILSRIMPDNPLTRSYMGLDHLKAKEPVPIEVGVGNLLVLRRKALEQVGAFDPVFFLFSEDTDLCYRLHLGGWRTYLHPGSRIIHAHGLSRRHASLRSHHHRRKSVLLFLCKHRRVPRPLCPILWLALVIVDAGSALAGLFGLGARESTWQSARPVVR